MIGRSVGAASMLGGFSGASRLKSSLKCSTHLFRCSSMLVITSPSRSPSFQSFGTCSSSQILLKRMWSILAFAATSPSSASAGMLSGPAALPLLICLMAML
ncbi:unnamed protein product, partial [Schistosoma mattheei]